MPTDEIEAGDSNMTSTSLLLSLPSEVLIEIIKWARAADEPSADTSGICDRRTLTSILVSCHQLSTVLLAAWPTVVNAYTVYSGPSTNYKYHFCGVPHRHDGPASVCASTQIWYRYGVSHRGDDLPAIIIGSRYRAWFHKGQLHRHADLPAWYNEYVWTWYYYGAKYRYSGPVNVSIIWAAPSQHTALKTWDGVSDVSAGNFDWGRVIDFTTLDPPTMPMIEYTWTCSAITMVTKCMRIVNAGGRYMTGR